MYKLGGVNMILYLCVYGLANSLKHQPYLITKIRIMKHLIAIFSFFLIALSCHAQLYNDNTIAKAKRTTITQVKGKFYAENGTSFLNIANGKIQMCQNQRENRITMPLTATKNGNKLTLKLISSLITVGDNPDFWTGMNQLAGGRNAKSMLTTAQRQKLKNEQAKLAKQMKAIVPNETMNWTLLRFDNTYVIVQSGENVMMYMTKDAWKKYKEETVNESTNTSEPTDVE